MSSSASDHTGAAPPPLRAYAITTAGAIGLTLEDEWLDGVLEYLDLLFGRAALVAGATIPDHVEPAPVFLP
jgi:hypothetical protein